MKLFSILLVGAAAGLVGSSIANDAGKMQGSEGVTTSSYGTDHEKVEMEQETSAKSGSMQKSASASKPAASDKGVAKIKDINKNPQKWTNKQVSVKGQIERLSSDSKSFVLDGDGLFNDQILVISKTMAQSGSLGAAGSTTGANTTGTTGDTATAGTMGTAGSMNSMLKEDAQVQLSGTVRRMSVAQIEKEYSLDLDPQYEAEFEGSMPVLVTDFSTVKATSAAE